MVHITPESKIGDLLESYPELEKTLMSLSPAFKKLSNPILRRTVAKVATLRQVAQIGNIPLTKLINDLREAVGQDGGDGYDDSVSVGSNPPDWFDRKLIARSFDARPVIEEGRNPMGEFFKILGEVDEHQICELLTTFVPAPLIELARSKKYSSWTEKHEEEKFSTYFIYKQENGGKQ